MDTIPRNQPRIAQCPSCGGRGSEDSFKAVVRQGKIDGKAVVDIGYGCECGEEFGFEVFRFKEGDRIWIGGQWVYFQKYEEDGTPLVLAMDGEVYRLEKKEATHA